MDQFTKKATLPQNLDQEALKPTSPKVGVKIYYGSNGGDFKVFPGQTVKEILSDPTIRETVGYGSLQSGGNIYYAIDGNAVSPDHVVQEGQTVEVIKKLGEKAA